ncbi:MAG: hypothetical protein AMXMBFR59_25930 [Rhodanobacteraceae bacterium]
MNCFPNPAPTGQTRGAATQSPVTGFLNTAQECAGIGLRLQTEWQRFAIERARKDAETWVRFLRCGSLAEVACVQFEASAELASDCLDAMNRALTDETGAAPSTAATDRP